MNDKVLIKKLNHMNLFIMKQDNPKNRVVIMKNHYKYKGKSSDRGHIPLSKMAVITIEQMLECLKNAGLAKSADLLQSECKTKKVK